MLRITSSSRPTSNGRIRVRELNDDFSDRDDGCGAGLAEGIGSDNEQGAPLEVLRAMTPQLE